MNSFGTEQIEDIRYLSTVRIGTEREEKFQAAIQKLLAILDAKPGLTCIACNDGQTALYCLNCARKGWAPIAEPQQGAFSHNPAHPVGTCGHCGGEMVHNCPRLGAEAGFAHKATGSFTCGPREPVAYTLPAPETVEATPAATQTGAAPQRDLGAGIVISSEAMAIVSEYVSAPRIRRDQCAEAITRLMQESFERGTAYQIAMSSPIRVPVDRGAMPAVMKGAGIHSGVQESVHTVRVKLLREYNGDTHSIIDDLVADLQGKEAACTERDERIAGLKGLDVINETIIADLRSNLTAKSAEVETLRTAAETAVEQIQAGYIHHQTAGVVFTNEKRVSSSFRTAELALQEAIAQTQGGAK